MRRWRTYKTLEWFIFTGFALAGFFALVAVVMVLTTQQPVGIVWRSKTTTAPEVITAVNPVYQTCTTDADCVWVNITCSCGCGDVVNTAAAPRHQAEYQRRCPNWRGRFCDIMCPNTVPQCVSGRCALQPPRTPQADTTGWKTYRNNEYGYTFQYPPEAKFYSSNEIGNQIPARPDDNPLYVELEKYDYPGKGISMNISVQSGVMLTEDSIDQKFGGTYTAPKIAKERVVIANMLGYKANGTFYFLGRGGATYQLQLYNGRTGSDHGAVDDILQQMLASFALTPLESTNWKTFTKTSNFGGQPQTYSVQYPPTWIEDYRQESFLGFYRYDAAPGPDESYGITFAIAGGQGQNDDSIKDEPIVLAGKQFTKRTWEEGGNKILIVYIVNNSPAPFGSIMVRLPTEDNEYYLRLAERVLESLKFQN